MRLTIIHPCVGRKPGQKYIRTWQMEPLPAATVAGLTPRDVDVKFYDDRMELIPFDEKTDLVAISVETYTARRAYQIASEYRKRGVPVVMGGFHASLCPDEVARYAEAVVTGEAEQLWPRVIDDARHGRLEKFYRAEGRTPLAGLKPDRSIFRGKRYLPIGLVEAGRGCHFKCEFCAVQTVFEATQTRRPVDDILAELRALKDSKKLFFFVDDNITSNMRQAKEFFRALIPLGIRWVSQSSINAAHDEEFLDLLVRSGFALRSEVGSMGTEVCSLDGEGCGEGEDCFCQCQTSVCRYWTYWQLGPDGWRYSNIGASKSRVDNGAVDGWDWGDSRPNNPSENLPPQLTFADICSAGATIYGVASRTSYGFSPSTMSQPWLMVLVVAIPLLLGGGWWLLRQRRRVQP